jgi:hypothetical protein
MKRFRAMTDASTIRDLKPDAQPFDEVRVTTVPRYKMGGISGDGWRISAKVELMRKGRVIVEEWCRDVEVACKLLAWYHSKACDDGKGYFTGEDELCDQEGCAEKATVTYRKKQDYCSQGHPHEIKHSTKVRRFCAWHSTRGDCGLDDADANYELIEGETATPSAADESPSGFGVVGPTDPPVAP